MAERELGQVRLSPVCRNEWVRGICEAAREVRSVSASSLRPRVRRRHPRKRDVMIYDYVDADVAQYEHEAPRGLSDLGLHGSVGRKNTIEGVACVASETAEIPNREVRGERAERVSVWRW